MTKQIESTCYQEATSQPIWCKTMKNKLNALEKKSNLDHYIITQRKEIHRV
jgi:hypothetical protein